MTLTGDSYISGLTCDADAIDLNGYTLTVGGETYTEGTESTGEAIEITVTSGGEGQMGTPPEGAPGGGNGPENSTNDEMSGEKPSGNPPEGAPSGGKPSGNPPAGEK